MSTKKCQSAAELNVGKQFIEAVRLECQSQIASSKAKINLYTHSSVGIGEHPDIAAEILKAAKEGAEAQDVLNFLDSL